MYHFNVQFASFSKIKQMDIFQTFKKAKRYLLVKHLHSVLHLFLCHREYLLSPKNLLKKKRFLVSKALIDQKQTPIKAKARKQHTVFKKNKTCSLSRSEGAAAIGTVKAKKD